MCSLLMLPVMGTNGTRRLYNLSFMHALPPRLCVSICFLIGSLTQAAALAEVNSITYPPFCRWMRALACRVGPLWSCRLVSAL